MSEATADEGNTTDPEPEEPTESPIYTAPPPTEAPVDMDTIPRRGEGDGVGDGG
jgi:hypothetical protein